MTTLRGIEHLVNYFGKELEEQYVIIGGVAASILMEDEGMPFRSTKDIDLVLLINNSKDLVAKVGKYVENGGYKVKESSQHKAKYYRFSNPININFPEILEIFARKEDSLQLDECQKMDENQFKMVVGNSVTKLDLLNMLRHVFLN